mmetsp:Transcript_24506/g.37277  ORF Transcript_24506/g.37277 Transcript_24506/m.37277 type:complete len:206 (+) Transcript_24506:716-1333(+)
MERRCISPPLKLATLKSPRASMPNGLSTRRRNNRSCRARLISASNKSLTLPLNLRCLGFIAWGLYETPRAANDGLADPSSMLLASYEPMATSLPRCSLLRPASNSIKVVFPVPFSPIMTMHSQSLKLPLLMLSLNCDTTSPSSFLRCRSFDMSGYRNVPMALSPGLSAPNSSSPSPSNSLATLKSEVVTLKVRAYGRNRMLSAAM